MRTPDRESSEPPVGPTASEKPSRLEEARQMVREYIEDQLRILKKLRERLLH
jgi:hypothetical protein